MTDNAPPPLGTVLITGGCGFLGSHIVRLLLERSSSQTQKHPGQATAIHILDLHTTRNTHTGAHYHTADLTSPSSVQEVLDTVRPDVIIHTASPVFTSGTAKSLEVMRKVNVDGTRVLLEAAKKSGTVKALVYTSSASVISDTRQDLVNADERWLVVRGSMQREYYSDTKAEAEELVLTSNTPPSSTSTTSSHTPSSSSDENGKGEAEGALLTTALRPSGIFGEGDAQLIPGLLGAYNRRQTAWQLGSNDNLFDFTYVGNVAHAHLLAAARLVEAWEGYVASSESGNEKETEEGAGGGGEGGKGEREMLSVGGGTLPQTVEARVDAQAFLITNASPVYFWDFARAVWFGYHSALTSTSSPPSTPTKAPAHKPHHLPFEFALLFATLASWVAWLFRLPGPSLDPARVRYSCMTRYYRIAKAQVVLGYVPVWELEEGVGRTVGWWAEQKRKEKAEEGGEGKKER